LNANRTPNCIIQNKVQGNARPNCITVSVAHAYETFKNNQTEQQYRVFRWPITHAWLLPEVKWFYWTVMNQIIPWRDLLIQGMHFDDMLLYNAHW